MHMSELARHLLPLGRAEAAYRRHTSRRGLCLLSIYSTKGKEKWTRTNSNHFHMHQSRQKSLLCSVFRMATLLQSQKHPKTHRSQTCTFLYGYNSRNSGRKENTTQQLPAASLVQFPYSSCQEVIGL